MKNILVGNGINIEFDNKNYTTESIVLRILKNCDIIIKHDTADYVVLYTTILKNRHIYKER